jgi:hypothetical protein
MTSPRRGDIEPDVDYEKSQQSVLPPIIKLDVTHSEVKRTLEERLDAPQFTVLAALMSTVHKIAAAL